MRGDELLEQMELVDPSYVTAADAMPKKKHTKMWRAIAAMLCFALCVGIIYVFPRNTGCPPDGPYTVTPMNTPWETDGNSITVTEVVLTDSYVAQDGTAYSEGDQDLFVIVRCKVSLAPGWSISGYSLSSAYSSATKMGGPIPEVSDNGEVYQVFLFSFHDGQYEGRIWNYRFGIVLETGANRRTQEFRME